MGKKPHVVVIVLSALALVLSGCASNANKTAPSPNPSTSQTKPTVAPTTAPSTPPATPTGTPSTTPKPCPKSEWNDRTESELGPELSTIPPADTLVDVDIARDRCVDRIVFTVNGTSNPGYSIGYVPVVYQDGKGNPVPLEGKSDLQVILRVPVPTHFNAGLLPVVHPKWTQLREIRFLGWYHGEARFGIGVAGTKQPFRVATWESKGKTYLIVEIAH